MESFPDARTISKQSGDHNDKRFNKQLKKIQGRIERAIKNGDKKIFIFLDPLHPKTVPFLRSKHYSVETDLDVDDNEFVYRTYILIKWQ